MSVIDFDLMSRLKVLMNCLLVAFQSSPRRSIRPCSKVRVSIFSIREWSPLPNRPQRGLTPRTSYSPRSPLFRPKLGLWIRELCEAGGRGEGHQHVEWAPFAEQSHQGFIGPAQLGVDQGSQPVRVWPAQVDDSARPGGTVHTLRQDNHLTDPLRQHVR